MPKSPTTVFKTKNGVRIKIDREDLVKIRQHEWRSQSYGGKILIWTTIDGETVYLHRWLADVRPNRNVKFRDGNSLNCSKENFHVNDDERSSVFRTCVNCGADFKASVYPLPGGQQYIPETCRGGCRGRVSSSKRPPRRTLMDDLLLNIDTSAGPTACWPWKRAKNEKGYGIVWDPKKKKNIRVHRAVYEKLRGNIPEGKLLRHNCDNPPCANFFHTLPGTPKENSQDAKERGRLDRRRKGGNRSAS